MLINYLKVTLRNLRKQRGFTFINVFGLATGLACCLLITLYVADELSYDRYNENADRIYRINGDVKFGGSESQGAQTPDPMGPTLLKDYPQVENYTRLLKRGTWLVRRAGGPAENTSEPNIIFADSTVFSVFTLPFVAGDAKTALKEPNTVVISESAARRHFGPANPIGQTLLFDNQQAFKVTGVMRDMPANSHFHTDFFLTMRSAYYNWGQWLEHNLHTYIVLREGVDPKAFDANFETILQKYSGPQAYQFLGASLDQLRKAGNSIRYWLMPLTDIHLRSHQTFELEPGGDIQYVYIFSAVALFILLIACINFMNLATARSAMRAKEVGVRKALGSMRQQLVGQFMTESIVLALLATGLALLMVVVALPLFNQLAAKTLTTDVLFSPRILPVLLLLPLIVGVLAGSYPAFFLSSFRPVSVLKGGKLNAGSQSGNLRSSLVVFQFAMSVILITGTLVIYRQVHYIQTKKLGFDREQILTVTGSHSLEKEIQTFKNEVTRMPGVVSGTVSGYLPVPSERSNFPFFPEGQLDSKKAVSMQDWTIDYDYVKTLGIELVQGRDFSRQFGTDSSAMLINESAAKLFGFRDPIGKRVTAMLDLTAHSQRVYTIIGVVKNFHYESMRENIGALAFTLGSQPTGVSFRLNTQNSPELVRQIEAKWKSLVPGQPFSYRFLDDSFDAMYRTEQRVGTLALTFAGLTILIACLGLFGLAAFMAEQRTKEIGVRKVLGASVTNIIGLLSKDFLKLVLIAILIATPIAWYAMNRWLQDFAYRIDVPWWVFALSGTVAVLIAFLTVSFQSIKAALVNPVKSLKSE